METIETLMGCLLAVCLLIFIIEYSLWIILAFCACIVVACIAEGIKWIWRKITKK